MVTCDACIYRLDELDRDELRAADVYEVGNHAKDNMGHALFFASDGRTALCIAHKRAAEEWGPDSAQQTLERGPR